MYFENRIEKVTYLPDLFQLVYYGRFVSFLPVFSVLIGTPCLQHFGQFIWLENFLIAGMILTGMDCVFELTLQMQKYIFQYRPYLVQLHFEVNRCFIGPVIL